MMLVMVFMINKVIFITMRNEDDCNDVLYNSTEHYCKDDSYADHDDDHDDTIMMMMIRC